MFTNKIYFGCYATVTEGSYMHEYITNIFFPSLIIEIRSYLIQSYKNSLNVAVVMDKLMDDILFVGDMILFQLEFGEKKYNLNHLDLATSETIINEGGGLSRDKSDILKGLYREFFYKIPL